jgi:IS1 family transposase
MGYRIKRERDATSSSLLTCVGLSSILFNMNKLDTPRRAAVIRSLIEGNSIRATCRITGTAKGTVLSLLEDVGAACKEYQDTTLRNLPCRELQLDELWSFVGRKERNTTQAQKREGLGDAWIWTAIDAQTKLVPCWHVGSRDADAAITFAEDLAARLANRVQITTDGLRAYITAVESAFGWNGVDYAQLVKLYGEAPEGQRRYSPSEFVGIQVQWIMGKPDPDKVSTSFAESHNLTMRMRNRRLTRLTNGYSKKLENHMHSLSLYFMAYNFVHIHHTLTKANKGVSTTPAMAAGVTNHVWKVSEIVQLLPDSN